MKILMVNFIVLPCCSLSLRFYSPTVFSLSLSLCVSLSLSLLLMVHCNIYSYHSMKDRHFSGLKTPGDRVVVEDHVPKTHVHVVLGGFHSFHGFPCFTFFLRRVLFVSHIELSIGTCSFRKTRLTYRDNLVGKP